MKTDFGKAASEQQNFIKMELIFFVRLHCPSPLSSISFLGDPAGELDATLLLCGKAPSVEQKNLAQLKKSCKFT